MPPGPYLYAKVRTPSAHRLFYYNCRRLLVIKITFTCPPDMTFKEDNFLIKKAPLTFLQIKILIYAGFLFNIIYISY